MGNYLLRWWTGGELEETTMSAAGASPTPDETSNFHSAGFFMEPKSEYFSPRVEEMMRSKSQFSSAVEHEIEHSRVHWSEVRSLSESSEDNNFDDEEDEEVRRENREVFAELVNDPQWHHKLSNFFQQWPTLKLGKKIAEGMQGAIFEGIAINGNIHPKLVFKVFKRGSRLADLKKQWPHGILRREFPFSIVLMGVLLEDSRFAFVMLKCWGDLRKLIDQAMQEKDNQGPPFPYEWSGHTWHAKDIMKKIAFHMITLHKSGIIHRDLKAANILLHEQGARVFVADYECSIGVVGSGFWRPPEILLALKNYHSTLIDFSEKTDVYSYAMICFEIVTGRLPFEGELEVCKANYDLVIDGQRPKLPSDLDVTLKDLIERCWSGDPNERPNFLEIYEVLAS